MNNPGALLPDQDCINLLYKGSIEVLPLRFAWCSCFSAIENEDIVIMHYVGSSAKPWRNPTAPNVDCYFRARENSPWRKLPLNQGTARISNPLWGRVMECLQADDLDSLREILWANPSIIDARNIKGGKTLLYQAAKSGRADILSMLLRLHSDYRIGNEHQELPIHKAAQWNKGETLKLLLESGASPYVLNSYGETAWDKARLWNSVDAIRILEEYDAQNYSGYSKVTDISGSDTFIKISDERVMPLFR